MTSDSRSTAAGRRPADGVAEPSALAGAAVLLGARDLRVGYRGVAMLPPISFAVRSGERWAVVGPNGSGKTTLLRTLLGLIPAVDGERLGDGAAGYVPQRTRVLEQAAGQARDVVQLGDERAWSFASFRRGRRQRVRRAMQRAGCEALAQHRYGELSDGQRQRVLVARALVSGAKVLALDEPTSAMDPEASVATGQLLCDLATAEGLGVLVVTHDLALVRQVATHLLVVDRATGWALAGPVEKVASRPEIRARYGNALGQEGADV